MLPAAPWLWIIAGVALAAAEMLVPSFLLVWPGMAAIAVGLLAFLFPGLGLGAQAVIFAVLAVGFTLAGRAWVLSHRAVPAGHPGLNRRAARLIGARGRAVARFEGGRGTVEIEGERWQARGKGVFVADTAVEVVGSDGLVLEVEPR